MANNLRNWLTTASLNGTADPDIRAQEGCAPSDINDDIRFMMAKERNTWQDADYFDWGDTATTASANTFAVPGDVTSRYIARRRFKATDSGTVYGTIVSSSFVAGNTTMTVVLDSGSFSGTLSSVALGTQAPTNLSAPANFQKQEYATTAGTSTAYTAAFTPKNVALTNGVNVRIKLDQTCGSTPTLAVDGLTAKGIVKPGNGAVSAGDLLINSVLDLTYDSTLDKWVMHGAPAAGVTWSAISADPAPAVSGTGYLCDTSGGAFTLTLPAAPGVGAVVYFADAAGTFNTNNLTIGRNSLKIMGLASDMTVNTQYAAAGLVYQGATNGWRLV